MRDDQEFNIKFVSLVEGHPCLYDFTRNDYHLSHVQDQAWAKIAGDVGDGATITDCKSRWKNIRGSYTKHLRRYYSESGYGTPGKRPYYLSEYLSFVFPFMKSRQPSRNVESTSDIDATNNIETPSNVEKSESLDFQLHIDPTEIKSVIEDSDQRTEERTNYDSDETVSTNEDVKPDIMKETSNLQQEYQKRSRETIELHENISKRRRTNYDNEYLDDAEYFERKRRALNIPPTLEIYDADAQFLLSVLPDMKKMTDKQKRKYKVGILKLIDDILDEPDVTQTSSINPSSPMAGGSTSMTPYSTPYTSSSTM